MLLYATNLVVVVEFSREIDAYSYEFNMIIILLDNELGKVIHS